MIGVPHPDFGETVLGIVIPEGEHLPDLERVMDAVIQSLVRFKHPRKLVVMDELPRNTTGKIQKNMLRDEFRTMFTEA